MQEIQSRVNEVLMLLSQKIATLFSEKEQADRRIEATNFTSAPNRATVGFEPNFPIV